MTALRTSTSSQELADLHSPQDGPDTQPLASARSTNGVSASSDDTGQMSLFGTTCERSLPLTLPTPCAQDATRNGSHIRNGHNLEKGGLHNVSLVNAVEHPDSPFSPQVIPASHSQSPGSDWARKMTGTYGRKYADYWLSSDPPDSWVRTLLGTSTWASMMCYLTWKRSATPQGRLLFRLVPSTPRTGETGFGLWGTPTTRDYKDTGNMENVPVNGLLGRQVLMPTPRVEGFDAGAHRGKADSLHAVVKQESNLKLNSAWVGRMMGYPDSWLILDGEVIQ